MNIEFIGYLATLLTIGSMMFNDQSKLRVVNSIGCIAWAIYGISINSVPVYLVNLIIFAIHLNWFYKWEKKKQ